MINAKNWLPFLDRSITIADLKLTVGGELNAGGKTIYFTFVTVCLFGLLSCGGNTKEENKSLASNAAPDVINELEGAWELVSTTEQPIANIKNPLQLKLFVDGYFCLVMKDSTGNWNLASGGTYETDGNVYKETHLYVTEPEWVGLTAWQQYEIKGDTLYKELFTKVVNSKGEDVTAQYPSNLEEKRVRVKK